MADRFFENVMPDFAEEIPHEEDDSAQDSNSLLKLLRMPYSSLSQRFKRAALDLKETVRSLIHFIILIVSLRIWFVSGGGGDMGFNWTTCQRLYSLLWDSGYGFLAFQSLSSRS